MTFQTFENAENNRGQIKRKNLKIEIRSTWLGMRDSNPRMPGPEPGALPLGDIPLPDNFTRKQYIFQGLALVFGAPLIDFGVIATQ